MGKSFNGVDEGFKAGTYTSLSGMLVYFQLSQRLAPHDILYKVEDKGVWAASKVCQRQPVKLGV